MAFKVIEGGGRGPDEFDFRMATQAFRYLAIEILRGLARGDDPDGRVMLALVKFVGSLKNIDREEVVPEALRELYGELAATELRDYRQSDDPAREIEHIILAGFQVAAETLCLDNAAQGRAGQRERRLSDRLEAWLRGCESRSREHGWSYVANFLKQNFPKPRKPPPAVASSDREVALTCTPELVRNRLRKLQGAADYDVVAYERWQKNEIPIGQLPPGKYPGGLRVYADGEWEAIVRSAPMKKREIAALGAYAAAKGTVGYVKGGGWVTTERLAARGFVEIIREGDSNRFPIYGITPAGEAEWLRSQRQAE